MARPGVLAHWPGIRRSAASLLSTEASMQRLLQGQRQRHLGDHPGAGVQHLRRAGAGRLGEPGWSAPGPPRPVLPGGQPVTVNPLNPAVLGVYAVPELANRPASWAAAALVVLAEATRVHGPLAEVVEYEPS